MNNMIVYRNNKLSIFWQALEAIKNQSLLEYDLLDNPFEKKYILSGSKIHRSEKSVFNDLMVFMEKQRELAEYIFRHRLILDEARHYAGIFRYPPGGYLNVHVDAGINKELNLRKRVTVLVMLGTIEQDLGGEFEFWRGTNCADEAPEVYSIRQTIPHQPGTVIIFENDDNAWHGVSKYKGDRERIVATASFYTDDIKCFDNQRNKAFFVPRPNEEWTAETYELRDKRANAELASEVYNANSRDFASNV